MKIARLLFAAIAVGLAGAQARLDKVYSIDIKVFEIPPFQKVTGAGPDGKGGWSGGSIGGIVTAGVPADPVFIQTELGPGAADEKMKDVLYKRKYLPRTNIPGGVSWIPTGSYSLKCREQDLGTDSKWTEFHEPEAKMPNLWTRNEFFLSVLPFSAKPGEAELNLKFAAKVKMSQLDPGIRQVLLDQNFKIAVGKTALVGFPQFGGDDPGPAGRGTVYILAVCVREQDIGGL